MTFAQAKTRLHIGVQRDDLTASEGDAINEAVRELGKLRSWNCMKTIGRVTLLAGDKSVAFPDNFKELNTARTPVHEVQDDGTLLPVTVFHRERIERRWNVWPVPLTSMLFFDYDGGAAKLYTMDASTSDRIFELSYFGFLSALSADGDTNQFLLDWPDMVVQRAKAILLSSINDDEADKAMTRFLTAYKVAASADAVAQLAGIQLKM